MEKTYYLILKLKKKKKKNFIYFYSILVTISTSLITILTIQRNKIIVLFQWTFTANSILNPISSTVLAVTFRGG
jgi:hypothetical protein